MVSALRERALSSMQLRSLMQLKGPNSLRSLLVVVCLVSAHLASRVDARMDRGTEGSTTHFAHELPGSPMMIRSKGHVQLESAMSFRDTSDDQKLRSYLIHFHKLTRSLLLALGDIAGKDRMQYIPHNTYLVSMKSSDIRRFSEEAEVENVYEVPDEMRIDHDLLSALQQRSLGSQETRQGSVELRREDRPDTDGQSSVIANLRDRADSVVTKLYVRVDKSGDAEQAALYQEIISSLSGTEFADEVTVIWKSPKKLLFEVPTGQLTAFIPWILEQPWPKWITERPEYRINNFAEVRMMQSGGGTETPIWDVGLTGAGQVIGVADTGIDLDACFFRDPSGLWPRFCYGKPPSILKLLPFCQH